MATLLAEKKIEARRIAPNKSKVHSVRPHPTSTPTPTPTPTPAPTPTRTRTPTPTPTPTPKQVPSPERDEKGRPLEFLTRRCVVSEQVTK